jgi:hypothetical protein
MDFKDLREYTQAFDDIGEVQSIDKSVDLFLEASGIIRRSYDLRAPAPLFITIQAPCCALTGVGQGENCLSLNIWKTANTNGPLPVLFWFHGGDRLDWWPPFWQHGKPRIRLTRKATRPESAPRWLKCKGYF